MSETTDGLVEAIHARNMVCRRYIDPRLSCDCDDLADAAREWVQERIGTVPMGGHTFSDRAVIDGEWWRSRDVRDALVLDEKEET